nr:MAG TPA: hypothetical protein [Caudoviricetes sp.]
MKKLWAKFKALIKWVFKQLKDKTNILIFVIVFLVLSSEVWIPYLLAVITGNKWWWGIGSACWAFWLAPFTPFMSLCIAITFAVRKIVDRVKNKRKKRKHNVTKMLLK